MSDIQLDLSKNEAPDDMWRAAGELIYQAIKGGRDYVPPARKEFRLRG